MPLLYLLLAAPFPQLVSSTQYFSFDQMRFCSPKPQPRRSFLSIVYPMDWWVWGLSILATALIGPILMWVTRHEAMTRPALRRSAWVTAVGSSWFGLGSLLGEGVMENTTTNAQKFAT